MPDKGPTAAPQRIQEQFWAALRRRTDWEHELAAFRESVGDPDAPAPVELRRRMPPRVRWSKQWDKRAAAERRRQRNPARRASEGALEAQKLRLLDIPPDLYIETITGEESRANGSMICPLPAHDDRAPSFWVYPDYTWRCFGCGEHGDIYELAGLIWSLDRSGRDFLELHRRLVGMLL